MSDYRLALFVPNLAAGGAERVALEIANELARRGFTVDMLMLSADGQLVEELHSDINIVDFKVLRISNGFMPLVRYLCSSKPHALLAFMWPLTVLAVVAKLVARSASRVVVTEHTTWSQSQLVKRPWIRRQVQLSMRLLFPKAEAVVCVSNGVAKDLAGFTGLSREMIEVIYNPIKAPSLSSCPLTLPPSEWWSGEHRRILAVGSLKVVKDYATLLHAFSRVWPQLDVRLLILGEGDCRQALEALVVELGLESMVFIPGFVSDVTPYYERADLHVLSSITEGFGNVIVEALLAGTPVVSTDCPSGPREILDNGIYGSLVACRDPDQMAVAISDALAVTHDSITLRARGRYFSVDRAVDQYEQILIGK